MKKILILVVIVAAMFMGAKTSQNDTYYLDDAFGEVGGASPVAT